MNQRDDENLLVADTIENTPGLHGDFTQFRLAQFRDDAAHPRRDLE